MTKITCRKCAELLQEALNAKNPGKRRIELCEDCEKKLQLLLERPNKPRKLMRKYVYKDTSDKINAWARKKGLHEKAPNNKENFPFYLDKLVEEKIGN